MNSYKQMSGWLKGLILGILLILPIFLNLLPSIVVSILSPFTAVFYMLYREVGKLLDLFLCEPGCHTGYIPILGFIVIFCVIIGATSDLIKKLIKQ